MTSRYGLKRALQNKQQECDLLDRQIKQKQRELDALVLLRKAAGQAVHTLQDHLAAFNAQVDASYRGAA